MKPPQIVLIEDNPADVMLIKLALEEGGIAHTIVEFGSGVDAVRALCTPGQDGAGEPDAILLDLHTPCTDAFETAAKLKERFAGVPITILSSSRARADKQQAASLKVGYLEKYSDLQEFLSAVANEVKGMLNTSRSA